MSGFNLRKDFETAAKAARIAQEREAERDGKPLVGHFGADGSHEVKADAQEQAEQDRHRQALHYVAEQVGEVRRRVDVKLNKNDIPLMPEDYERELGLLDDERCADDSSDGEGRL